MFAIKGSPAPRLDPLVNLLVHLTNGAGANPCATQRLDDMDLKQLPKKSGEFLLEIIMRRHETRSTIMTTGL